MIYMYMQCFHIHVYDDILDLKMYVVGNYKIFTCCVNPIFLFQVCREW